MKRLLLAGIATCALAGPAAAADLPLLMPPTVSNTFYNWTGFYVGINGGGGWGGSTWDGVDSFGVSGSALGLTAGYNVQFARFVIGVETDVDWSGAKGTTATCLYGCNTQNSWLGTVRGRFGYAFDRFLPFLSFGVAAGNINATRMFFPGSSSTNFGWAGGVGFEVAVFSNVTVKAEYLFVRPGDLNCGLNCGMLPSGNVSYYANLLRGGINLRF